MRGFGRVLPSLILCSAFWTAPGYAVSICDLMLDPPAAKISKIFIGMERDSQFLPLSSITPFAKPESSQSLSVAVHASEAIQRLK